MSNDADFDPVVPPSAGAAAARPPPLQHLRDQDPNPPQHQQQAQAGAAEDDANMIVSFLEEEDWIKKGDFFTGLREDVFAGITLTMVQVPPAIAYALIAHMPPLTGLTSSFWIGLIVAIFGGRPGAISATAGALAVVYPKFVDEYGPEALYLASIFCGIIFMLPGLFRVAKMVRLIPASVMIGFVDGLAIVLARGQIASFKNAEGEYVTGAQGAITALLVLLCFAIMMVMPRFTTLVPSAFAAVVVGTVIEHIIRAGNNGMASVTVGDLYALEGEFPAPSFPQIDTTKPGIVGATISLSFVMAIIGLVESLLSVHVMNVLTETRGSFEREAIAMGAANIVCGLFKSFAGCAVIGPCLLNFVSGGGRRRLSAFITGIMMLIVFRGLYVVINWFPMGALSAVVFGICYKTFDWRTMEMIFEFKIPITDSIVILVVTIVTVFADLAVAVGAGIGCAIIFFAIDIYRNDGVHITSIDRERDDDLGGIECCTLNLRGTMFFVSASEAYEKVQHLYNTKREDCADVVLDFGSEGIFVGGGAARDDANGNDNNNQDNNDNNNNQNADDDEEAHLAGGVGGGGAGCTIHDFSSVDTLNEIGTLYSRHGRRLHLRNLDPISKTIVDRARPFLPDIVNDDEGHFDDKMTIDIPKETRAEREYREAKEKKDEQGAGEAGVAGDDSSAFQQLAAVAGDAEDGGAADAAGGANTAASSGDEAPIPTVSDLVLESRFIFFVHSQELAINVPLPAVSFQELISGRYRQVLPCAVDVTRRLTHMTLAGRKGLSEEEQEEIKALIEARLLKVTVPAGGGGQRAGAGGAASSSSSSSSRYQSRPSQQQQQPQRAPAKRPPQKSAAAAASAPGTADAPLPQRRQPSAAAAAAASAGEEDTGGGASAAAAVADNVMPVAENQQGDGDVDADVDAAVQQEGPHTPPESSLE